MFLGFFLFFLDGASRPPALPPSARRRARSKRPRRVQGSPRAPPRGRRREETRLYSASETRVKTRRRSRERAPCTRAPRRRHTRGAGARGGVPCVQNDKRTEGIIKQSDREQQLTVLIVLLIIVRIIALIYFLLFCVSPWNPQIRFLFASHFVIPRPPE